MSETMTADEFNARFRGKPRRGARGGRVGGRKVGMNKTERAYAAHLDAEIVAGRVLWYWFEGLTIKLGKDTRYTPDFAVQMADGEVRLVDAKAWARATPKRPSHMLIEEDAKVKLRLTTETPFRVFVAAFDGARWVEEEVCP